MTVRILDLETGGIRPKREEMFLMLTTVNDCYTCGVTNKTLVKAATTKGSIIRVCDSCLALVKTIRGNCLEAGADLMEVVGVLDEIANHFYQRKQAKTLYYESQGKNLAKISTIRKGSNVE